MTDEQSQDRTFSDRSLFGSTDWTALRLGVSKDTFFRARPKLEDDGFPTKDPLTNLYLKADVDAWVANRATIVVKNNSVPQQSTESINYESI